MKTKSRAKKKPGFGGGNEPDGLLFDHNPLPMWAYDLETYQFLKVNHAAVKHYGYSEAEFKAMTIKDIRPREDVSRLVENVEHVTEGLEEAGIWRHLKKDGSLIYVEIVSHTLVFNGRGAELVVVMDITARRQAEKALRESEERYRGIFNGVRDAIFVETLDGKILAVNDPACEMYGYSRAEFITKTVQDLVPQGFPLLWADSPEGLLSSLPMITVNRRANGGLFPVEISGRLQTITGQKALLVVSRDITERQQAEDKIQRQIEYLSALRDIDEAIASALDVRISLQRLIAHATRLLQADAVAILLINSTENTLEYAAGSGFQTDAIRTTSIKIGESYAGHAAQERRVIQIPDLAKEPVNQFRTGFLEGEKFAGYYAAPLIVKGQVIGVIEVFQLSIISQTADWLDFFTTLAGQAAVAIDHARLIEDLKHSNLKLEKRVQERTAELERANRAKDEFLAAMSHELRTPLNSILGLSESLLEQRRDPLSDQQQASLQIIETSGRHLLELINDILDLSKIEAGKVDYYPQTVDVDTLCRSSMAFIREQSARKSITLNYREDHGVSSIHVDPRRVKQILVNLLANAVKFTPDHGGVELQVHADAERDLIQFAVRDTGIGIAEADLKRLFQPFVQVNGKLNRQFEGTGLGLALVQKLVDLHGGSVEVESELGKGSRFTVNLPWGRHLAARQEAIESGGAMPAPQQIEKPDFPPGKVPARGLILLAEDNMSNILTIGEYLESHGRRVIAARDGLEAIQIAEENNPDIILMDIQMPVMDGLEAIRRLRANPRFASTPIIALTALAMSGDRERCLQAGANEYMSKPVNLKALRRLIDSIFE